MGKNTIITGGTNGIGKAIAKRVLADASEDDRLLINYGHNNEAAEAFLAELPEEDRRKVTMLKADMSSYDAMETFVAAVRKEISHIDWLILNVGVGTYKKFDEYTPELWDSVMRTNVGVPAMLVKELKDLMAEGGCILFMGSHAGQATYSSSVVYSASKAAAMFLARSLVKVFDDKLVRVNTVAPGFIETGWQDGRSQESRQRINNKIAAHRFGMPEEVAELCYSILTNDYLNGSVYDIHGGYDYF